ncbi:acyl-CoA dehydrogenase [bacterium]|nr:acyl-CoA dehydrogenase [Chloroflexi bacterium CFX6]RIL11306.1 MAG: acyl-CoA dehydrogenase [bacterium]
MTTMNGTLTAGPLALEARITPAAPPPDALTAEWIRLVHAIGPAFEQRAPAYDRDDAFVAENYATLKQHRFLAAAIPAELGGGGVSHAGMCDILRVLAQYCGSTALALSMHQHLLAANVWKYRRGQGAEEMLRRVAAQQPVLVSTGARDWLESNGEMIRADGGYRVKAVKMFASQSAVGDVLITSAPYDDPEHGPQVLHFPVPMQAEGVSVLNDWHALGMRGTGSHTVRLDGVFVPDAAVVLKRPRGAFHPFWNVILTVAMPYIMAVYTGIAEKAAATALGAARDQARPKPHLAASLGAMHNTLTSAQVHLRDMVRIANDLDFEPLDAHGQAILARKTNVANACVGVVTQAMAIVGGQAFYRGFGLERLFRDVQGAHLHPLPEKDQQQFLGEHLLRAG